MNAFGQILQNLQTSVSEVFTEKEKKSAEQRKTGSPEYGDKV